MKKLHGGAERFTSSFLLITKKLMNEIRQYFYLLIGEMVCVRGLIILPIFDYFFFKEKKFEDNVGENQQRR